MPFTIFVKNIVSRNCHQLVLDTFDVYKLVVQEIRQGGEIVLRQEPSNQDYNRLKEQLSELGYGIIEDNRAKIIARVKSLLENLIAEDSFAIKFKVSEYLASRMTYEYHYLSSLFSQLEGITIEKFLIQLKIERIKELIQQGNLKLSEMSHKLGYSSPAHLTNQFKKTEGITPSGYRAKIKRQSAQ